MGKWTERALKLTEYPCDNSDNSDNSPSLAPKLTGNEVTYATFADTRTEMKKRREGEIETDPELKPFDTGDYEERAAMVEYGAGAPRQWADGYARLCTLPRHPDYTETRWQGLIDDAGLFLDQWAAKVDGLGWKTQEVFGVHHAKPSTRIDLQGLVPCIRGRKVVAVTADSATIETITGARQRIFRRTDAQSPGRVAVWEIDPKDENACPPRQ